MMRKKNDRNKLSIDRTKRDERLRARMLENILRHATVDTIQSDEILAIVEQIQRDLNNVLRICQDENRHSTSIVSFCRQEMRHLASLVQEPDLQKRIVELAKFSDNLAQQSHHHSLSQWIVTSFQTIASKLGQLLGLVHRPADPMASPRPAAKSSAGAVTTKSIDQSLAHPAKRAQGSLQKPKVPNHLLPQERIVAPLAHQEPDESTPKKPKYR